MRRRRRHPRRRTAAEIEWELNESVGAHMSLVVIALLTTVGAAVWIAHGGGWVAWLVLVFAALALVQGLINLKRLRSLQNRVREHPEVAETIHAIPRVPFLQGRFGSGQN